MTLQPNPDCWNHGVNSFAWPSLPLAAAFQLLKLHLLMFQAADSLMHEPERSNFPRDISAPRFWRARATKFERQRFFSRFWTGSACFLLHPPPK
jgi:hypothetical protein